MANWVFAVVALVAAVCLLLPSTDALKCVQCDTQPNSEECRTRLPEARDCPSTINNYCYKQESFNRVGDLVMVRRFCNAIASTRNGCQDLSGGMGKTCEYSCNVDGCNSVSGLVATRAIYFVALLPLIFYYALSRQ